MIGVKLKKILKTEICNDGTTFEENIDNLITHRRSLHNQGISMIKGKYLQPKFSKEKISTLEKHGSKYVLMALNPSMESTVNSLDYLDGFYAFVVFISEPYKLYCAKLIQDDKDRRLKKDREGHTSFRGAELVCFAGVIKFELGKMIFWNNASGHFKPAPEKRYNLLPHIKLLLPEHLFRSHKF